jgi:hypothetical protein
MNDKLNVRIAEEVGIDDGSFLPLRNGKWHFPDAAERGAAKPKPAGPGPTDPTARLLVKAGPPIG